MKLWRDTRLALARLTGIVQGRSPQNEQALAAGAASKAERYVS